MLRLFDFFHSLAGHEPRAQGTRLNSSQNYYSIVNRRHFFWATAGFAGDVVFAKLPFKTGQRSQIAPSDREFLIVNGWVLTRGDVAASE
jgi:hypothetical protein